ncbi:MAG: vWA domain-containing protein [Gammaproteobacteria bacterium]
MKHKLLGITLFAVTLATVLLYPSVRSSAVLVRPVPPVQSILPPLQPVVNQKPVVEVVFVLDTTGSMSGLIQTAKEKIWSIASTMAQAKPSPEIRIGLVAYRDRGDQYVTRSIDLSDDLDSMYGKLMDFVADGGGDGPESVNAALNDAVNKMSWSTNRNAYQVIFLIGDAPPHMDYGNEPQYPAIIAAANQRGIVVNTIQSGNLGVTVAPWQQMARLGNGRYFQVEQAGGALAMATPFDSDLARLSEALDDTRLYFGSREEKAAMESKTKAAKKLHGLASTASRARRAAFNASKSGEKNFLGTNELVEAVVSGEVDLDKMEPESLPASLQAVAPEARQEVVEETAAKRRVLQSQIKQLSGKRDAFLADEAAATEGAAESLDHQIYDTVRSQAGRVGLDYEDGPAY